MPPLYGCRLFALIATLLGFLQLNVVKAQYKGRTFLQNEVGKIISPQMSDLHLNQPSVFKGFAVLAGNAEHEIWDITDPYKPVFVSGFESKYSSGEAESHQVSYMADNDGNYYLVTTSGRGIDIWNITDVRKPVYVAAMELPNINYGDVSNGVWGISCQGNYIYVGATNNGLYVVDASNKSEPKLVKTVPISKLGNIFPGPLFALGNVLIITPPKNKTGIVTVDISDSENPVLIDFYNSTKKSYIGGFYGKYAFLEQDISIFDVTSDPSNIEVVHVGGGKKSEYMSFDAGYLYLGGLRGGTQGIYKYNLSDINDPTEVLRIEGRDARWDDQFSCAVGNIIIIADDQRVDGKYVGAVIGVHDALPDNTGPKVEVLFPKNEAKDQPTSTKIGISLSDMIEPSSLKKNSLIVRPVGGSPVEGTWSCTYTTINFEPANLLQPNTTYEIVLNTHGVTDLMGNDMENPFISIFSTGTSTTQEEEEYVIKLSQITPVEVNQPANWAVENPLAGKNYVWELADGTIFTGESTEHTFQEAGRFPVTLKVYGETTAGSSISEAEEADLSNVEIASTHKGFSGSGYIDYPASQGTEVYVEWNINRLESEVGSFAISYANGQANGARKLNLRINSGDPITIDFPPTDSWNDYREITFENISFQKGINYVRLTADAGTVGPNIDYARFEGGSGAGPKVAEQTISFVQIVHYPLTSNAPQSSTQIIHHAADIWTVNVDANSVSSIDKNTLQKNEEISVGSKPVSIALTKEKELWVVNKDSWNISIIDPSTKIVTSNISLPRACQPSAIVISQNESLAYVSSEVLGEIYEISTTTKKINRTLKLSKDEEHPTYLGGLGLDATGNTLFATRFISKGNVGELFVINTQSFDKFNSILLQESKGEDGTQFARGIPNYLNQVAISPDGKFAWLPSKKDNISRGQFRDGLPLEHDNTVRAISSIVELGSGQELLDKRIDIDNVDRCHSVTFSPLGDVAFIALPSNNEIYIIDVNTQSEVARLPTEEIPVYTYYDPQHQRLFSLNFLGRSVSVFDVSDIISGNSGYKTLTTIDRITEEPLSPLVFKGKKIFYDASSEQIAQDGYLSCASCHLEGGSDGQIWDLTSLNEGLRNTIDLRGKSGTGHGRLHWTANFDEVHDFEHQIRLLNSGTGLLEQKDFEQHQDPLGTPKAGISEDLDALAEYVASLSSFSVSPYKHSDGSLTADAAAGRQIFNQLACFQCHGGDAYTNSEAGFLYDVGTLKPSSGKRIGSTLLGLDVPTLKGLWYSSPYLHDGSATSIREVLITYNPDGTHADISSLSSKEIDQLITFLHQIDDQTPAAQTSDISIDIVFPQAGQQYTGPNIPIDISFHIPQINYVEYYIDGTLVDTQREANFDGNWANAKDGFYTLEAKAFYGPGNTAIVSQCIDIEIVNTCHSPDACEVQLEVTAILEGMYQADGMRTELADLLPLTDPYLGTTTVNSIPANVVDWVLVELRDPTDYKKVLFQYPALLQKDGKVVVIGNSGNTISAQSIPSIAYVAILHRNHLPVITNSPVSVGQKIDFSDPNTLVKGFGTRAIKDGKALLFAGDYDGNGLNNNKDFNVWSVNAALLDIYHPADGDGNGIINNQDFNLWRRNSAKTGVPGVTLPK